MKKVLVIGTGLISIEYAKVLTSLNISFTVVGRGVEGCNKFKELTGKNSISGGLQKFLKQNKLEFSHAINAVGVSELYETTKLILNYGINNILVEKPGALHQKQISELNQLALKYNSSLFIAYNRRFFASTLEAKKIIKKDGGLKSFNFEFTEWAHEIKKLNKPKEVLNYWFLSNSSHVVDLAFFIGGLPKNIISFHAGKLDWHPSASIFHGSGVTENNSLFSYNANWASPGRWSLEFLTKNSRLIFKPMEKLKIQKIGSVEINEVDLDYSKDLDYKPGFYMQTKNFTENNFNDFCGISFQLKIFETYIKIANYKKNK